MLPVLEAPVLLPRPDEPASAVLPAPDVPPAPRCYAPLVEWEPRVQRYMEAVFGVEPFSRMRAALATPPLSTCLRVNPLQTTPEVSTLLGVLGVLSLP